MTRSTTTTAEHRQFSSCDSTRCLKLWSWNNRTCYYNTGVGSENDTTDRRGRIDENVEQASASISAPSGHKNAKTKSNTFLDKGRCIQQWLLNPFNTVLPVPTSTMVAGVRNRSKSRDHETNEDGCELLVASINGPNSFMVWNTGEPQDYRTFCNTRVPTKSSSPQTLERLPVLTISTRSRCGGYSMRSSSRPFPGKSKALEMALMDTIATATTKIEFVEAVTVTKATRRVEVYSLSTN
mmetsp:Transcript_18029/g.39325  ORF Transcript_18029/g.39325 Transcript_18029/m.39325 type:complete len:239 (-) Transcript_18029:435-1151(-)